MKVEFAVREVSQAAKDLKWAWAEYEEAHFELEYYLALHPKYENRDLEAEARFQKKARELAAACFRAIDNIKIAEATQFAKAIAYYGRDEDPEYNRARTFNLLNGGIADMNCNL